MLALSPLADVELKWIDRSGRVARTRVRCPSSVPPSALLSYGNTLASAMQDASSAVVVGVKVAYKLTDAEPPDAAEGPDAATALALFYRNGEDYNAFYIPAPLPWLWETTGPLAGIRLNMADPAVASVVELVNLALERGASPLPLPLGLGFIGGGLAL